MVSNNRSYTDEMQIQQCHQQTAPCLSTKINSQLTVLISYYKNTDWQTLQYLVSVHSSQHPVFFPVKHKHNFLTLGLYRRSMVHRTQVTDAQHMYTQTTSVINRIYNSNTHLFDSGASSLTDFL